MFNTLNLLSPVGWEKFFGDYFEKEFFVIKRNDPRFYGSLFSLAELDGILFSATFLHPAFRVIGSNGYPNPAPRTFTLGDTNTIDPIKFLKHYNEGRALAMDALHTLNYKLRAYCYDLEHIFGHPVQANAYLTPAKSQDVFPRFETHDVILLQLHGKKTWRFYKSAMKLPSPDMGFVAEGFEVPSMTYEIELEEGDLIYIPRGLIHDAYTTNTASLHIASVISGITYSQYFIESIHRLALRHEGFRKFFPGNTHAADSYKDHCNALLALLSDELSNGSGFSEFRILRDGQVNSIARGHFMGIMTMGKLNFQSVIRLEKIWSLEEKEKTILLRRGTSHIEFPHYCLETVQDIFSTWKERKVEEINGYLDAEDRIVIVRRLILEGVISWVNAYTVGRSLNE